MGLTHGQELRKAALAFLKAWDKSASDWNGLPDDIADIEQSMERLRFWANKADVDLVPKQR